MRLLRLVLPLVVSAAALVGVPIAPVDAVAASCSVGSVACVDTDGDGLADPSDGCPTVASANPTGCPSASRRVSLTWLAGQQRLQAQVSSPVPACAQRARVVLWRVRPHQDYKVFGANVAYSGRLRIRVSRGATYYVSVSPSYSSGVAECGRAVSRRVRVRRS